MEPIKTENTQKKKRKRSPDTLTLYSESLSKISKWQEQVDKKFNSMVKITRNELLNIILSDLPEKLPVRVFKKVKEDKLTEANQAEWIYKRLKEAEKKGEDLTIKDLLKQLSPSTQSKSKIRTKPKKNTASTVEKTQSDNLNL